MSDVFEIDDLASLDTDALITSEEFHYMNQGVGIDDQLFQQDQQGSSATPCAPDDNSQQQVVGFYQHANIISKDETSDSDASSASDEQSSSSDHASTAEAKFQLLLEGISKNKIAKTGLQTFFVAHSDKGAFSLEGFFSRNVKLVGNHFSIAPDNTLRIREGDTTFLARFNIPFLKDRGLLSEEISLRVSVITLAFGELYSLIASPSMPFDLRLPPGQVAVRVVALDPAGSHLAECYVPFQVTPKRTMQNRSQNKNVSSSKSKKSKLGDRRRETSAPAPKRRKLE